jgi:carboxymethylenebutenolidase
MSTTRSHETLARLWEDHIRHEFETRSTEDTLATMVEDADVDHVPVLTGGCGKPSCENSTRRISSRECPLTWRWSRSLEPSGSDQLVDEMVIKFTHSVELDWMLPGVRPTDRRVEVALVVVVRFGMANWLMSTFIGTKPRCWSNSVCSTRRICPSLVSRAPGRCLIPQCQRI